jgi:hypothetical protein
MHISNESTNCRQNIRFISKRNCPDVVTKIIKKNNVVLVA